MIENLLKYQQADAQLREIEKTLAKSDERRRAVEAKKFLDGVNESVNKLDAKAGELLSAYESIVSEREKLEEQKAEFTKALEGIEDRTGATYLLKKVDELLAKIKSATNAIKKISDEVSALANEYMFIKKKTKEEQEAYKLNAQKYNEFKAGFDKEREEIKSELEKIKQTVDAELMEKYAKKRDNKMYPIVYEVEGNVCGRCKMELSLSEIGKLKTGGVIECSCGCLLYKSK